MVPALCWSMFGAKLVRYCLYMWLPMYLTKSVSIFQYAFFLMRTILAGSNTLNPVFKGIIRRQNLFFYCLLHEQLLLLTYQYIIYIYRWWPIARLRVQILVESDQKHKNLVLIASLLSTQWEGEVRVSGKN